MQRIIPRSANLLSTAATLWAFVLAFVILADVIGRGMLNAPLQGTKEIVSNSIVAVVFLQLPLTIEGDRLLRTTLLYDHAGTAGRLLIDLMGYGLGLVLFAAIALGTWEDMLTGWRIGEFEGEGAFRFPVYLIRTVIFGLAILCAFAFLHQAVQRIARPFSNSIETDKAP